MKIFNWVRRRFTNSKAQNGAKMDSGDDSNNVLFEDWSGGILTIGTFGYNNTENYNLLPDCSFKEDEDQEDHESDHIDHSHDQEEEYHEMEEENIRNLEYEYVRMKKMERTTLADLLSTDDNDQLLIKDIVNLANCKTINYNNNDDNISNNGISLDSKQQPIRARRHIHKLHQLMRRMLKRKIHPHLNSQLLPKCQIHSGHCASLLTSQDAII